MKSLNLRTLQNACGYVLIGFSFLTLTFLTVKTFAPNINTEAESQSAEQTVGPYEMSMANDSVATVAITPTDTQTVYTASNDLTVRNTCDAGATITLTTASSSSNSLNRTGSDSGTKEITATTTTALDNYTWGYALNNSSTYYAVPKLGETAATVYSASAAQTTALSVPVKFGVKTNNDLPSGTYTNDVIYTMTPNPACLIYSVAWDFDGGTAKSGAIYPSTLGWGNTVNLSQLTPTRDGYTFAGWTNGSNNFAGTETAADLNPGNAKSVTVKAKWTLISYVKNFDYTGGEQTWTTPYAGYYKLEVWGAGSPGYSNGKATASVTYGGYSVGIYSANKNDSLRINVGQVGATKVSSNRFNGGGYGGFYDGSTGSQNSSGGGATHIAKVSGQLNSLSAHATNGNILIVAGGAGGFSCWNASAQIASGGNGGGYIGNSGKVYNDTLVSTGGTQTEGGTVANIRTEAWGDNGSFGQGGIGGTNLLRTEAHREASAGGGGGYYGGAAGGIGEGTKAFGGGGGSGYIGSSNLISGLGVTKHMTCYSCTTSSADATRTYSNTTTPTSTPTADVARIGNGYARITWIGDTL